MRRWYVNCRKCGNNFSVSEGYEGMHVKCRDCGTLTYIPNRRKHIFWWKTGIITAIIIGGCVFLGLGTFVGLILMIAFLANWINNS